MQKNWYATTILVTWFRLQKNGQKHHLLRPLGSTIDFQAYCRYSCRQSIPVSPGWCFPNSFFFPSTLCAVTHLVSLSLSMNHEARLEDELTFDQLKFNSMKNHKLMSYLQMSLSIDAILISLVLTLVQTPIWQTGILIDPSSLSIGISPSCLMS